MIIPVWGTMRMLEHSEDVLFWETFLENLHNKGITHLHSSIEYSSFSLLSEVLRRLSKKNIIFNHIVKLAEPSFHENGFFKERFLVKLDTYERLLFGPIVSIQWMWRSELEDKVRIKSFLEEIGKVEQIAKEYPLYCFPYSQAFAKEAIKINSLNGLVLYWNKKEVEYEGIIKSTYNFNMSTIVLRPFHAGNSGDVNTFQALNFCKGIDNLKYIVFTATKENHLNKAFQFFNEQH